MISPSNPHIGMRYHCTESHMVEENIVSLKHLCVNNDIYLTPILLVGKRAEMFAVSYTS